MNLFDINTAVGHWPFRRVPNQTVPELRKLLESRGIAGAAVANTNGLFYKNCHDANLELAEWIAEPKGFFTGVATLNPMYPAWERDLRDCAEKLGFRALRMTPQYHDYKLAGKPALALAQAAAELGLAIFIPHRLVDTRQRHWFDVEKTNSLADVGGLCAAVPKAKVILTESRIGAKELLTEDGKFRWENLYVETSRFGTSGLPGELAAEHMVFGTGAPFKYIMPALLKLETSDLTDEQRERVGAGNGRRVLGI